jgi:hypothetical protein
MSNNIYAYIEGKWVDVTLRVREEERENALRLELLLRECT